MEHKSISLTETLSSIEATEAKNNFGALIERAQREPVVILRHGRQSSVIMNAQEFAHYREYKLQKLREQLAVGEEQVNKGEFSDATPEEIMRKAKQRHAKQL